MPRGLIIVLAVAVVVGVAVLEGLRSNRWGASEDLKAATARLDAVPAKFGDWESKEAPLDPKILKIAEATGSVSRIYTNRKNGDRFTVLLLCGPPGPIGAHTPEICYGGLGYKCVGKPIPKRIVAGDGAASFWTARFEKPTPTDEPIRVFWAWGVDGKWEASANPRTDFALRGVLYKLYVVRQDNPERKRESSGSEGANAFLADFLPIVRTALQKPTPG